MPVALSRLLWDFLLATDATLLGEPIVTLHLSLTGLNAQLDRRIWDVAPDGTQTLVARGAYRLVTSGTARYALHGNGWRFPAGHTLRLEVLENDAPFVRIDNEPSSIARAARAAGGPDAVTTLSAGRARGAPRAGRRTHPVRVP